MMNMRWLHIVLVIAMTLISGMETFYGNEHEPNWDKAARRSAAFAQQTPADHGNATWIIKWNGNPSAEFRQISLVRAEQSKFGIIIACPKKGMEQNEWLSRVAAMPDVAYVEPNHNVSIAAKTSAKPNDLNFPEQKYLKQIQMEEGWNHTEFWRTITIAVVDTGVDLTHPDLKANLIDGVNLVEPGKTAQDDNGHGTNVAGVIAATANNHEGVAGIVWKTKIMPIKALETKGNGTEDKLGEGIAYAVDHGAKIVVLSVGMNRDSTYMREIAAYAEERGVLLVAASGNENRDVKFPAAYPSVLAVGGITPDYRSVRESNFGPELDVVAPWTVYTTALGGGYAHNQGTSMAAPQVAGVAALLWSKYPDMVPYEIRNMIRQTAEDVEGKGWDPFTGYGLLRADRALTAKYRKDMYESNDTILQAKPLPVDSLIYGELAGTDDTDWFYVDAPYDGELAISVAALANSAANAALTFYDKVDASGESYANILAKTIHIPVKKGHRYLKLNMPRQSAGNPLIYSLNARFHIFADPFENNDKQFKAYSLPPRTQTIRGTFDHDDDQDWYMLNLPESGSLSVTVVPDTARMDLELGFAQNNGKPAFVDWNQDGAEESIDSIDVLPGQYYIAVRNVISADEKALPVRGEYTMNITFSKKLIDPNEPNDKPYQAVTMKPGTAYEGVIQQTGDTDWFTFKSDGQSLIKAALDEIPGDRIMSLTLYDANQRQLAINVNSLGNSALSFERLLPKGTYYIRITSDQPFYHQYYRLKLSATPLVAGYKDISGHWAEGAIVTMRNKNIFVGYQDFTFRPEQGITRAEAVSAIARAFGLKREGTINYNDVARTHWAFANIAAATNARVVAGYPDHTFRPDQKITRLEMAAMIGAAKKLTGIRSGAAPFGDVNESGWGADLLAEMKQNGWISGYADGAFHPDQAASRAEFAAVLNNALIAK